MLSVLLVLDDKTKVAVKYTSNGDYFSINMNGVSLIDIPKEIAEAFAEHYNVDIG